MTNPTTPPTDPLQKARELRVMEKQWLDSGFHPQGDDRLAQKQRTKEYYDWYIENLHHAFPSIHAELEKVTAERDELLKGYRAMRSAIDIVTSGAKKDDKTGDMIVDNVEFGNLWIALTSFLK